MKKIATLLLIAILCAGLCSCDMVLQKAKSAITGTEVSQMPADYITTISGEEYTYELYRTYVKLTEYVGKEKEIVIPEEIDDRPVKIIGSLCFFETAVTSVEISKNVEYIEASAFYYADSLKTITIPDTVKTIGMRAFGWCNALERVVLGSNITEIPDFCFNHCSSLVSIDIPQNVKTIGLRAFSYCKKLNKLTVPENIISLGERSFVGCESLEFVVFENENIKIESNAFDDSENIVVIADYNSSAYDYCSEYNLLWSTSETVDPIRLGVGDDFSTDDSSDEIDE